MSRLNEYAAWRGIVYQEPPNWEDYFTDPLQGGSAEGTADPNFNGGTGGDIFDSFLNLGADQGGEIATPTGSAVRKPNGDRLLSTNITRGVTIWVRPDGSTYTEAITGQGVGPGGTGAQQPGGYTAALTDQQARQSIIAAGGKITLDTPAIIEGQLPGGGVLRFAPNDIPQIGTRWRPVYTPPKDNAGGAPATQRLRNLQTGEEHLFGYNPQTGRFDIDFGPTGDAKDNGPKARQPYSMGGPVELKDLNERLNLDAQAGFDVQKEGNDFFVRDPVSGQGVKYVSSVEKFSETGLRKYPGFQGERLVYHPVPFLPSAEPLQPNTGPQFANQPFGVGGPDLNDPGRFLPQEAIRALGEGRTTPAQLGYNAATNTFTPPQTLPTALFDQGQQSIDAVKPTATGAPFVKAPSTGDGGLLNTAPFLKFETGGSFIADRPMYAVDAATGQKQALFGERGDEMINVQPMEGNFATPTAPKPMRDDMGLTPRARQALAVLTR